MALFCPGIFTSAAEIPHGVPCVGIAPLKSALMLLGHLEKPLTQEDPVSPFQLIPSSERGCLGGFIECFSLSLFFLFSIPPVS